MSTGASQRAPRQVDRTLDDEPPQRNQEGTRQRNDESPEQLPESVKGHREIIESLEKRMDKLIASALQFSQLYFVFQGVIINVTYSQAANPLCEFTWIPLSLSLMVSTFQLCGLLIIMRRFNSYYKEWDINKSILRQERRRRNEAQAARERVTDLPTPDERKRRQHLLIESLVFVFFMAITSIVCYGVYHVSCRKESKN